MSGENVALIAVENCSYSFDELFTFIIPDEFVGKLSPGCRVIVPFGRGNAKRQGFVYRISVNNEDNSGLKSICEILDSEPVLNDELILLAEWLHDICFCTYFVAAKALLPGGMCLKTEKLYKLADNAVLPEGCPDELRQVFDFLDDSKEFISADEILKKCRLPKNSDVLDILERKGILLIDRKTVGGIKEFSVRKIGLSDKFTEEKAEIKLTEKQQKVVDFLRETGIAVPAEISYFTGVSDAVIKKLTKNGVCTVYEDEVFRSPSVEYRKTGKRNVLSPHQYSAFEKLKAEYDRHTGSTALLFGVTGSGKTSVFLEIIDVVLADNRSALVLVPEISLTPQTMAIFGERYGKEVAVLHSKLSAGERFDEWRRIKKGEARVVVGTRSAIFAPLENIGVIIIDEEQEHTYKSEMSPRYNAKEVARFRSAYNKALLVLASATPAVETYARAVSGRYTLCELSERYGNAVLPDVVTVDMTDKEKLNSFSAVSMPLTEELEKNLANGEQSILLINRRGYNTFVVCKACKHIVSCPKCSISLTYHSVNNRLMCHYCGYSTEYTDICPQCGDKNIRYSGFGTQRVEQELKIKFPDARIIRMDADTTNGKNSHDKAFSAFAAGEYDIMLGTQMVAKGLDFPNVTLVGVTSADNEMYNDDFRCSERTFDLITQVVGRAGRGNRKGRAVIQTVTPESNIIEIASRQDYKAFFQQEMVMRKAMIYPPFCDICIIGVTSPSEQLSKSCALEFFDRFKEIISTMPDQHIIVLGPLSPRVSKINDSYRQRLIIKCKNSVMFRSIIADLLKQIMKDKKYKNVGIYADINPENSDC